MTASPKLRPALVAAIIFVLAFDLAWVWQRAAGAWGSELGGHPDEAAHYVTGLMIRDYLAAGLPGSPMAYAERYYEHFPKIGLGVWPPVFYAVQAAWTVLFTPALGSVLLLLCALAAGVALLVHLALRDEYGSVAAGLGALLWISLPLAREYYATVMAETLSAGLMFGAALLWGRFLDREKTRDALLFGLVAALAILTKGTGLALALMAPLALAFTGRWRLVKRPAFWGAAAMAAVLAGPWTWKFRAMGKGGWLHPAPTWEFSKDALPYYAGKLGFALGIVLLVLVVIGLVSRFRSGTQHRGRWAAAGALIVAVFVFQGVAPVGLEARHLIPALPAAVMFATAGAVAIWRRTLHHREVETGKPAASGRWQAFALATVVAAAVVIPDWMQSREGAGKRFTGFSPLAADVVRGLKPGDAVLVASDARGEGMFISEMALRDAQRPTFTVRRGSKALVPAQKEAESWRTGDARERFATEAALVEFLTNGNLRYLVLDDSMPDNRRLPYHDSLKRAVANHTDRFYPISKSDVHRGERLAAGQARLYRIGPSPRPIK